MSDTDEFIVFATNDDATELEITTDCSNENPRSPLNYRNSSNRLYTFSRNQDDDLVKNSSNQVRKIHCFFFVHVENHFLENLKHYNIFLFLLLCGKY